MSPNEVRSGVATYGRPWSRRRRVELVPQPTVCPDCLTDTETSSCPDNCPTRDTEEPS